MTKYHHFSASTAKKQALAFLCMMCLVASSLWAQSTQLTISNDDPTQIVPTKVYDGTTSAQISHTGALIGIDTNHSNVVINAHAEYITAGVGGIKPVVVSYTLGGTDSIYYIAPQNDTLFAAITPKQLTITGTVIDTTKVYTGSTYATNLITSVGTLAGVIDGESISPAAVAYFEDPNVGNEKNVIVSYTLYGGSDANNYIAPASIVLTADITPLQIYAPMVIIQSNKIYDGTIICNIATTGELLGVVTGDTVNYRATASFSDPNVGNNKPVNVYSYLYGPQSRNYNVVDTSTHVYTSNIHPLKLTYESGVVQLVKEYDGTTDAIVLVDATPTNVVNNDNVTLVSRAYYDTPDAGDNKTITFGFQIANDPNNNYLAPDSYIYSNAGRIILPTIIDTTFGNHGLLIATTHLCPGSQFNGTFTITQGTPTYYTLSFDENAIAQGFQNGTTFINFPEGSNTVNITFDIPVNCAPGSYALRIAIGNEVLKEVYFNTIIKVSLSNQYLVRVFDDVVSIDNRENLFITFQWYLNDNPIEGATKPYYQDPRGYLDGSYSLLVNKGTASEQFICPITFINDSTTTKSIVTFPNPVVNTATVKLNGFGSEEHLLTVYNSYGAAVVRTTFNGQEYVIDMTNMPQGTYMINVDGFTAKTVKL